MAKKNRNNKSQNLYKAPDNIIDNEVVNDVAETNEISFENVPLSVNEESNYQVQTVMDNNNIDSDVSDNKEVKEEPVIENTVSSPSISETKKPVSKRTHNGRTTTHKTERYQLVFAVNASPLQLAKITNRLRDLNVSYEYDGKDILGQIFLSESDAIGFKKLYAGQGLKPTIRKI